MAATRSTMRKLAAELGVSTTTIYWHVGNRDELVFALVARQAERQAATRVRGDTPSERICGAAHNIWRHALANRNVTALASQAGATTLLELPLEVALVAELEAAGVRGPAARDGLRAVLGCVAGFLVMAWRRDAHVPDELRPAALWASVEDDRLSDETLAELGRPADLDRLFRDHRRRRGRRAARRHRPPRRPRPEEPTDERCRPTPHRCPDRVM